MLLKVVARRRLSAQHVVIRCFVCATRLCASLVLASASAHANSDGPNRDEEKIIVADEVRTAFYEHAPGSLADELSKAVGSWCSKLDRRHLADSGKANAQTVGWLCGKGKLLYFRNVYVTGAKGPHGLVCENDGTSDLKFYGVDLANMSVESGSCVPVELNGTTYQLHFENVNRKADLDQ